MAFFSLLFPIQSVLVVMYAHWTQKRGFPPPLGARRWEGLAFQGEASRDAVGSSTAEDIKPLPNKRIQTRSYGRAAASECHFSPPSGSHPPPPAPHPRLLPFPSACGPSSFSWAAPAASASHFPCWCFSSGPVSGAGPGRAGPDCVKPSRVWECHPCDPPSLALRCAWERARCLLGKYLLAHRGSEIMLSVHAPSPTPPSPPPPVCFGLTEGGNTHEEHSEAT